MLLVLLCAATSDDYVALKALYEATNGSEWQYNQNWNMNNTNVCEWNFGDGLPLLCSDAIPRRVTYLCASICCPRLHPLLAAHARATLALAGTCTTTA